jgi:hypothetical protein
MSKIAKLVLKLAGDEVEIHTIGYGQRNIPFRLKTVKIPRADIARTLKSSEFWVGTGIKPPGD